jgi:hypothetical protein
MGDIGERVAQQHLAVHQHAGLRDPLHLAALVRDVLMDLLIAPDLPGTAPMPLGHYASNLDGSGCQPATNPAVAVGIQVAGEPIDVVAKKR